MGNNYTKKAYDTTVYIVGEVDFRVIRLDWPWFRKTNMSLRYPQFTNSKPKDLFIDYEMPLKIEFFLIPQDDVKNNCCGGMDLRLQGKTRKVMLEGKYDMWNGYHDMKVIDSEIVPITKDYAAK